MLIAQHELYTSQAMENIIRPFRGMSPAKAVALDPGVCTFQAAYGIDGSVALYGYEARKQLNSLHLRIDGINRDIANIKKRAKYTSRCKLQKIKNRRRKKAWLYQRIQDLTTTMHYEVIKSLRKFPAILLPEFGTQEMMKKLCKNQKRELQSLPHYTFKQRLAHKCKLHGQSLLIVNEAYSTITCFKCDHQSRANVNDRWFHCQQCVHQDHRDINPGTSK
eukprot:NODE_161_length_16629_cov_0.427344.p7 type:complete len:220 gc:universal NODE_161_length_16629_cov_0.427344:6669-6010(-)